MIDDVKEHLEAAGHRVYLSGDVPGRPDFPYLLLYALQPSPVRSMARPEWARHFRFGVTVCDLSSRFIESTGDEVEVALEGARISHPLSRVEWVARGPTTRDPEVTEDGAEVHTLPIHFMMTIPRSTT